MIPLPIPDFFLANEAETLARGVRMAEGLRAGDVLALVGGLGAGKTHLTKGLVQGLGGEAAVSSPTFSLVHEYHGGRLPVFHFDWYRLESEAELLGIGWADYLDGEGVCVVEWADRFPGALPLGTQWWELRAEGEGRRLQKISPLEANA